MAEYEGKEVKLNDPFRLPSGSKKKFGVYVKNPKTGNVIKVEFGDPNLSIKRDDPERLKNFRARHNCDQKTDKTTPGYWSCKFWEKDKPVSKLLKKGKVESVGEGCGCDECMNESRKKKITYVINRRTGEVVYGPTDVADAKQFLKKQPQPRKFVIRDIRESVQLDEGTLEFKFDSPMKAGDFMRRIMRDKLASEVDRYGGRSSREEIVQVITHPNLYSHKKIGELAKRYKGVFHSTDQGKEVEKMMREDVQLDENVKTVFDSLRGKHSSDARVMLAKIKKFGFDKQYRKMMQNFKKNAASGDGLFFIEEIPSDDERKRTKVGDSMNLEVLPVDGNYYNLKKLGDSDEQKRGGTVYKVRLIAIKEGVQVDENVGYYLPGQATTSHGGKSGRGGKPGPRMTKQRRHREEVLMHLITNGIKVTNQPSMVTQKGSSDTFAVPKNQVKKAEKILDDFFKKAYIKKSGMRRDNYTIIAEGVNLDEQKIRTQVEFDSLTDAVKSVKFHPTRDKGREVAIYKLKDGTFTPVTLPNGPFEKILKAKGAKRIATVKNVDGKAKVIKEQRVIQESGHEDVPSAKNKVMMNLVSLKKIHKILCCMNPHASLPSWLTDKLTIATSKLDTVGDYLESQVMQSESTDPNFWLIELNEDEDDKKKKGKNPRDTKYYTKSGRIKKSPEDKETGLPKKYVSRMTDADAKQKAAEIKARKKYDKDDPRRYKPTEVDKKYAGKGEKSKYTKAYDKMFGKDDD